MAIICEACSKELLPTKIEPQQMLQCGGCGFTFRPAMDAETKQKTDRMAKWSFWLAISSLFLCMLTGIPAMILGIRSWRRMRFRVVQKKEKRWAVIGTILGGLTGVSGTMFFVTAASMGMLVWYTFEASDDPVRAQELADKVFQYDPPIPLVVTDGLTILTMKRIRCADDRDKAKQRIRLAVHEFHMQPNAEQVTRQLSSNFGFAKREEYELAETEEIVDWKVLKTGYVLKETYKHKTYPNDPKKDVIRYIFYRREQTGFFGGTLMYIGADRLDEDEVRKLLESLRPNIFEAIDNP